MVNVVAAVLVVVSIIPIYLAQRLSGSTGEGLTGRALTGRRGRQRLRVLPTTRETSFW